jgi:hypothetical protein
VGNLETVAARWQFCDGYDEQSANEVRAWGGAHGDVCLAVATRTDGDRWQLGCGDVWSPDIADMDARFGSASSAIEYIATTNGVALVEAVCRCGTGRECD